MPATRGPVGGPAWNNTKVTQEPQVAGITLDAKQIELVKSISGYFNEFPLDLVGDIHLGGHDAQQDDGGAPLLIDSHAAPVTDPVWQLYAHVIARGGARPTLIEWDNDETGWPVLVAEAARAKALMPVAKT